MMKIGLICIGLDTYWKQYEGLLPRLLSYGKEIERRLQSAETEVIFAGMVDSPAKAQEAATLFRTNGVEMVCIQKFEDGVEDGKVECVKQVVRFTGDIGIFDF